MDGERFGIDRLVPDAEPIDGDPALRTHPGLALVDVAANGYQFRWMNRSCERLFGCENESYRSKPIDAVCDAETQRRLGEQLDRSTVTRADVTDTVRLPVPEPETQFEVRVSPVIRDGDVTQGVVSLWTATAENRQTSTERQERQQLEAILENVPIITYQVDTDGTIMLSKGHGLTHFDCKPDELVGTSVFEAFSEHDGIIEAYQRALAGEHVKQTVHVDGAVLDEWYRPVFGSNGQVTSVVGVSVDVTRREQHRKQLERELERLDRFADIVAHELRNPLTVALGRLQLAREESDSDHLAVVSDALDRINALVTDILTLAREGRVVDEWEPVSVATAVGESWSNVSTPGMTVSVETDAVVRADRSRCKQLFENLFRNSVEHARADEVTVGPLDGGFYVEDDGVGIPAGDREVVFETSYTTADDGTGFGLSIVAEIVDAHGWDIRVTEGSHGGARFEITGVETV